MDIAEELQSLNISSTGECDPRAALELGRRLRSSVATGSRSAVQAALEVVIRSCIFPHLSPGVGVPVHKRVRNRSGMAGAVKAAGEIADRDVSCQIDPLYEATEFLWELVTDSSLARGELQDIILSKYLADLWGACFQLCYGRGQVGTENKRRALEMMETLIQKLPVAHAVEAVMLLLLPENHPPSWLKPEAGKVLSRLVMKDGGVVAALERLVGGSEEGDALAQKRVAVHLGRCPTYVATAKEYYRRICPQVLELLVPPTTSKEVGDLTARAVRNMHQTAVAMVSVIARLEPQAVKVYVLEPVMEPLAVWTRAGLLEKRMEDSFLKLGALIAAGDERVRKMIISKTSFIAPQLLALHQLLEVEDSVAAGGKLSLGSAVGDLVLLHVTQPVEHSLSVTCSYVVQSGREEESPARTETHTTGRFLSRLLLSAENWHLSIRLMSWLFNRVLHMRAAFVRNSGTVNEHRELLRLMAAFEEILESVGDKSFEKAPEAATAFAKELLSYEELSEDPELLELVLRILHRLLIRGETCSNEWRSIEEFLVGIYNSSKQDERIKRMAYTLQLSLTERKECR